MKKKKRKDAPHMLRRGTRVLFGEIRESDVVFKLEPGGIWERADLFIKVNYCSQALLVQPEIHWVITGVSRPFVSNNTQVEVVDTIK